MIKASTVKRFHSNGMLEKKDTIGIFLVNVVYLLLFHVCTTSASTIACLLAAESRKSNRYLMAGGSE